MHKEAEATISAPDHIQGHHLMSSGKKGPKLSSWAVPTLLGWDPDEHL